MSDARAPSWLRPRKPLRRRRHVGRPPSAPTPPPLPIADAAGRPLPNPVSRRLIDPAESSIARRLLCRTYDTCLDVAIARDWPGFACTSCNAYVPPVLLPPPGAVAVDSSA